MIDYIDVLVGIHYSRAGIEWSQTTEAKRLPKLLLLEVLDYLINVPFCNLFPFTPPYITSVLSLEQEMAFIGKQHFFPLIFSPIFVFLCPFYSFYFHCTCQKLLFAGSFSFSTHCNQSASH